MTATFFPILTSDDPPVAPAGWKWRLLGDVARLESGHTPSRREPSYWEGGNIPWLSLKDIRGLAGRYVVETQDKPSQKGIDNSSARVLPKGTVAFCRTASVGKVAILGRDMATSQDFANWVCGHDILPEYLYEALKASGGQFDKEKQGSTHKTIYMPVLERFRVLLPPLAEQRRIADILDKADAIRRKRKEAIDLTEELLRSAFLDMFGDPVTNPKGWPVRSVDELCESKQYGTAEKANETHDGLPVLRMNNVTYSGEIDLTDLKWVPLPPKDCAKLDLRDGDVLFNRVNSLELVGKTAVWHHGDGYTFAGYLIRLRFDGAAVGDYVSGAMNMPSMKRVLMSIAKPSINMANISGSDLARVNVPVPPVAMQRRYRDFRRRVYDWRGDLNRHAAEADYLFNSLVARAFSGALESSR